MKRQNDRILKEELPRSVGAQYAAGDQWRNNSRKNERMETKQKQYPVVGVTGDRSKVQCCKEQYCIGTWNVRSMNKGMGFSWQEYGSGLPFPSPGDLPNPGIEPRSPALQADALPSKPPGKQDEVTLRLKYLKA